MDALPQPYSVLHDKWKDFFSGNSIYVPNNEELLVILH